MRFLQHYTLRDADRLLTRLLLCPFPRTQFGLQAGRSWELLEGFDAGQTQVDSAQDGDIAVWAHPIDAHYVCRGLTGWPKLCFQASASR